MNRLNLNQPNLLNEIQKIVMDTVDVIEDIVMNDNEEEVIVMEEEEVKQMKVKLDNSIIKDLTDKPIPIIQQVQKQQNEEHGIYELELEPLESALFHIKLKCDNFIKHFEYNLSSNDNFIHTSHIQTMKKGVITVFINNLTNRDVKFKLMYKCELL